MTAVAIFFLALIGVWIFVAVWAKKTVKQTGSRFNLTIPEDDHPDSHATLGGIDPEEYYAAEEAAENAAKQADSES